MPSIVEVIGRSRQGVTNPYICRGSDDNVYFVKGRGAGRDALVREYIGSCLAQGFGLRLPDFKILNVPEQLLDIDSDIDLSDLGPLPVFGSRLVPGVVEITHAAVRQTPLSEQRDVFLFDWWVKNGDRPLTELGGNPNLLWSNQTSEMSVIDFNLAFDQKVTLDEMLGHHVFRASVQPGPLPKELRDAYGARFARCLQGWGAIIEGIPEEWWDGLEIMPDAVTPEKSFHLLSRYLEDEFWP